MREYWGTFKSDTRLFMEMSFSVSLSGLGQLNFFYFKGFSYYMEFIEVMIQKRHLLDRTRSKEFKNVIFRPNAQFVCVPQPLKIVTDVTVTDVTFFNFSKFAT